jgi:hypothetical protein
MNSCLFRPSRNLPLWIEYTPIGAKMLKTKNARIKPERVVGIVLREAQLVFRRMDGARFVMEATLFELGLYQHDFTTPFEFVSYSILLAKGYK